MAQPAEKRACLRRDFDSDANDLSHDVNSVLLDILVNIPDFGGRFAEFLYDHGKTEINMPLFLAHLFSAEKLRALSARSMCLHRLLATSAAVQKYVIVGIKEWRRSTSNPLLMAECSVRVQQLVPAAWKDSRRLRKYNTLDADDRVREQRITVRAHMRANTGTLVVF
eukprot:TRINITY_DN107578_c0_g1_i1.p1 TRINITY_DN107578_c0_g1~~TRINITY_DN107578_c0_g1_i1.p1  ORF type:complete len:167 (+),score=26.93 TRINITY_DN107578_c0_g1_i1:119-619(+)